MLSLAPLVCAFAPAPALTPTALAPRASTLTMETVADLKVLAEKLNPAVGYWDPLKLSERSFWDNTNEETIGWLRHAEIKHGRIAMAGFVGYLVHAQGIHFPWKVPGDELCGQVSPVELFHSLPEAAKVQIILGVGFLEWWSELRLVPGELHYMKGGKPGYIPDFDAVPDEPQLSDTRPPPPPAQPPQYRYDGQPQLVAVPLPPRTSIDAPPLPVSVPASIPTEPPAANAVGNSVAASSHRSTARLTSAATRSSLAPSATRPLSNAARRVGARAPRVISSPAARYR